MCLNIIIGWGFFLFVLFLKEHSAEQLVTLPELGWCFQMEFNRLLQESGTALKILYSL